MRSKSKCTGLRVGPGTTEETFEVVIDDVVLEYTTVVVVGSCKMLEVCPKRCVESSRRLVRRLVAQSLSQWLQRFAAVSFSVFGDANSAAHARSMAPRNDNGIQGPAAPQAASVSDFDSSTRLCES